MHWQNRRDMESVNDIACLPGLVNLDIQDIMSICKDKKSLQFSMGEAKGENATIGAVRSVMNKMTKQDEEAGYAETDILLNVTGSEDCLSMYEIQEACEEVYACLRFALLSGHWCVKPVATLH